jgi:hypothetical protein
MRARWTALVMLLALGCEGSNRTRPGVGCPDGGCERETTFFFDPPRRGPLDVVLVIDPAALVNRSEQLRSTLRRLGPYLHGRFDSQVAIVSARPAPGAAAALQLWPQPAGACGLHAGEPFLRDVARCGSAPNFDGPLEDQLACAVADVTAAPAPGPGRPIEALVALLSATRAPALAGLIRDHAHLSIGIVTAGDDPDAVGPLADVLHAGLLRIKGGNAGQMNIQAFVALPDGQSCDDQPAAAGGGVPSLAGFVQRFVRGGIDTSCVSDWPARLEMVVPPVLAAASLIVRCLPGPLADRDPLAAGIQPECVLQEVAADADAGAPTSHVIPACTGAPGEPGCWSPVHDVACQSGLRLEVTRECQAPEASIWRMSCATGP